MKRGILSILVLILTLSSVYAYVNIAADSTLKDPHSNIVLQDKREGVLNKAPIITLNYPGNGGRQVVNGNLVEFSWRYNDLEGDEQLNYHIEIDDNPKFLSPTAYYGLSETKRKIYLVNGNKDYYWRTRARDLFGWGDFSPASTFYLDLTRKVCQDGTPYFQCSSSDSRYCDQGVLVDDCALCGCPLNNICTSSGKCQKRTCFEGTVFSECSNKKPNFCQNGNLVEVCSLCGCPQGKECNSVGSCSDKIIPDNEIIVEEKPKVEIIQKRSFFQGFASFLRALFLS